MAVLKGLTGEVLGKVLELVVDGTQVGRDDAAQLVLHDSSVSNHHAKLWCESRWLVEDLGSTNRTLLNGAPLDPHESFELQDGDKLTFGRVQLEFDGSAPSGALADAQAALDAADQALAKQSEEIRALRDHAQRQDEAIRSRDGALKEWEKRMNEVNQGWVSREEFEREVERIRQEVDTAAQERINASVRRYNEMEARYVQAQAKLETAERALREKESQLRDLQLRRA